MTQTETHTFTRQPGSMGCTDAVCSCGWTESTNVPSQLYRAENAHRNAMAKIAARSAR
jgi:hypothetical protein